jgi:hypothetical protein
MSKAKSIPDPTRGKTRLIWESTYEWTVDFFNKNSDLKVGAEIGIAWWSTYKSIDGEHKD